MQSVQDKMVLAITASLAQKQIEGEVAGPFIDIIISLIPVLIPLLIQCFATPAKQLAAAQNPGWAQRWRLRSEIFRRMPGLDSDTEHARNVVFDAALAAAKKLTTEDIAALSA